MIDRNHEISMNIWLELKTDIPDINNRTPTYRQIRLQTTLAFKI